MFHPSEVRLTSPAEAVGFVPYLLGFHPADSLLVLAMRDRQLLFGLAIALPTTASNTRIREAADHVTPRLTDRGITAAILVGYGPVEPVQQAIDAATTALRNADIAVRDALRLHDGHLWHLTSGDDLDRLVGVPFDPATTAAAAAATVLGLVALPHRGAMTAQLAPIDGPARHRFTAATTTAIDHVDQLLAAAEATEGTAGGVAAFTDAARQLTTEAITAYTDERNFDDDQAALLTVLLGLPMGLGAAARQVRGDSAQIRLWTDLTRHAEPVFATGPAILLALTALQAGNGALAADAVRRALDSSPDDELAQLLSQLIQRGVDPQTAAHLITD